MNIIDRINIAKLRPLSERYYRNSNECAQDTMTGVTHYYSKETLRAFGVRVTHTRISPNGVYFGTISTQKSGFRDADGREYRVAIHDLNGTCLYRSELGTLKSRAQADKAFAAAWFALTEDAVLTAAIAQARERAARSLAALTAAENA